MESKYNFYICLVVDVAKIIFKEDCLTTVHVIIYNENRMVILAINNEQKNTYDKAEGIKDS